MNDATNESTSPSKWVGRICIILFVLLLGFSINFGQALYSYTEETKHFEINLFSSAGVLLGFFSIVFWLTNFKAILRLSWYTIFFGLVGSCGFLGHTILSVFSPLPPLQINVGPTVPGARGFSPKALSGAEQWIIDGQTYNIESTYYLTLPEGLQFTINYPIAPERLTARDKYMDIAFPIMRYVFENDIQNRVPVTSDSTPVPVDRIGVVLIATEQDGSGVRKRGHRTALGIDEIKRRIDAQ